MRVGVFSDVHSNLEALEACLARCQQEKVQAYICCGDLIGYGPDPEKCVQRVLSLPLLACVQGNHDAVFMTPGLELFFNYEAQRALAKNKEQLSSKSVRALTALPVIARHAQFTAVHGAPSSPIQEYFVTTEQFHAEYDLWDTPLCFVGHTHLSFFICGTAKRATVFCPETTDTTVNLQPGLRYVINPGSVGKPRDNTPQAAFGIWDSEKNTFRFLREPYDYALTQAKMRARNYPAFLIDGLALGV